MKWPCGSRQRPTPPRFPSITTPTALLAGDSRPSSRAAVLVAPPAERGGISLIPLMLAMFLIGAAEVMAGPLMGEQGLHFRVSSARIAWLPGSYALVYACLAPFLGPISDRFGRKVLLVPGLFGLGMALSMIALARSFSAALAFSAIAGVSAAAIQPNTLTIINDAIEPRFQLAATG